MASELPFKLPVRVANDSPDNWYFDDVIRDAGDTTIAWTRLSGTAENIVACVNALSGIDDPAAFVEAFEEMRKACGAFVAAYTGEVVDSVERGAPMGAALNMATAALARAAEVVKNG